MVDEQEKSDLIATRQPIKDCHATERPREKLLQLGLETLLDGELMAVLLRIGISTRAVQNRRPLNAKKISK